MSKEFFAKENIAGEFFAGARAIFPLLIPTCAFAVIFGALATISGLSHLDTLLSCLILYTGAGQFMFVTLVGQGATDTMIVLLVGMLAVRHFVMSAYLSEKWYKFPKKWRYILGFWLTDEVYATLLAYPKKQSSIYFTLGAGIAEYSMWTTFSVLGTFIDLSGNDLILDIANFFTSAIFMYIAIGQMTSKSKVLYFTICAIFATIFTLLLPAQLTSLAVVITGVGLAIFFAKIFRDGDNLSVKSNNLGVE
ncbi:MAG: AzlC family ABC transporter permease [Bifidobacteriaceae bacterium]|jgi:predicted branched-subunit amino acid permease|nr:AzlC family ABC transporter permease [Bifidobacteriaceae bacterium]